MKSLDGKKFTPVLGFKSKLPLNIRLQDIIKIMFYFTQLIRTDEQTQIAIVGKEIEANFEFKKCDTSKEYIKYYSNEQLKIKNLKNIKQNKIEINLFIL